MNKFEKAAEGYTTLNIDIKKLEALMEEMANAPKEELPYKRQPGERCMYEIQRKDNRSGEHKL